MEGSNLRGPKGASSSLDRVAEKLIALLDSRVELDNKFVIVGEDTVRITPIKK